MTIADFIYNPWNGAPPGTFKVTAHTVHGNVAHASSDRERVYNQHGHSYRTPTWHVPSLGEEVWKIEFSVMPAWLPKPKGKE